MQNFFFYVMDFSFWGSIFIHSHPNTSWKIWADAISDCSLLLEVSGHKK